MTQREFESRVKGVPRVTRGFLHGRWLRPLAELLFGAALVLVLIADGDGLLSIRSTPVSKQTAQKTAIDAFGAGHMHAARDLVRHSGGAADSRVGRGVDFDVDGFFARAWDAAISRMQPVFAAASVPELPTSIDDLIDQAAAAERAFARNVEDLFPSSSDATAMSLNSNLPMLAGAGAFAALIALCFAAAMFISARLSRGARTRAVRHGARHS